MSERDSIDELLRTSLASDSVPTLSDHFDRRLARRLGPRRRDDRSNRILTGYAVVGLGTSVWTMHATGLSWLLILPAALLPLTAVTVLLRRYV